MLTTGNQMKAARMLAEIEQIELAALAQVSVGTIRKMEGCGAGTLRSSLATVHAVQVALEGRGVEFQNHGRPGVRLAKPAGKGGA